MGRKQHDVRGQHLAVVDFDEVAHLDVGPRADDELAADEALALGRVEGVVGSGSLNILDELEDGGKGDDHRERR